MAITIYCKQCEKHLGTIKVGSRIRVKTVYLYDGCYKLLCVKLVCNERKAYNPFDELFGNIRRG